MAREQDNKYDEADGTGFMDSKPNDGRSNIQIFSTLFPCCTLSACVTLPLAASFCLWICAAARLAAASAPVASEHCLGPSPNADDDEDDEDDDEDDEDDEDSVLMAGASYGED